MRLFFKSNFVSARVITAGMSGVLCTLALAPPVILSAGFPLAAAAAYFFFSPVCHQMPDRSFAILGFPLAVCHRCLGIYLGLLAGSLIPIPWMHRSPATRRLWLLWAMAPIALDALLPWCGLWVNTGVSRFVTGLCFGIPAASLLVHALAEFFHEAPWQRFAFGESSLREAFYE